MTKSLVSQIQILGLQNTGTVVSFQFLYNTKLFTLNLDKQNVFDLEKISLLEIIARDFNMMIPNLVKVMSNDKYLIFKIRYKLNRIPENFSFIARIVT